MSSKPGKHFLGPVKKNFRLSVKRVPGCMSVHPPAAVVTYTASRDALFSMRLRPTHWGGGLEVPYLAMCKLEKHCCQHVAELAAENWGCGGESSCGVNPWILSLGTGAPMPRAWEDGMRSGFTLCCSVLSGSYVNPMGETHLPAGGIFFTQLDDSNAISSRNAL